MQYFQPPTRQRVFRVIVQSTKQLTLFRRRGGPLGPETTSSLKRRCVRARVCCFLPGIRSHLRGVVVRRDHGGGEQTPIPAVSVAADVVVVGVANRRRSARGRGRRGNRSRRETCRCRELTQRNNATEVKGEASGEIQPRYVAGDMTKERGRCKSNSACQNFEGCHRG